VPLRANATNGATAPAAAIAAETPAVADEAGAAQVRPRLLSDFFVECPGGGRLVFAPVPAPWPADRPGHAARALDAVKATAGWEPAEVNPDRAMTHGSYVKLCPPRTSGAGATRRVNLLIVAWSTVISPPPKMRSF